MFLALYISHSRYDFGLLWQNGQSRQSSDEAIRKTERKLDHHVEPAARFRLTAQWLEMAIQAKESIMNNKLSQLVRGLRFYSPLLEPERSIYVIVARTGALF